MYLLKKVPNTGSNVRGFIHSIRKFFKTAPSHITDNPAMDQRVDKLLTLIWVVRAKGGRLNQTASQFLLTHRYRRPQETRAVARQSVGFISVHNRQYQQIYIKTKMKTRLYKCSKKKTAKERYETIRVVACPFLHIKF